MIVASLLGFVASEAEKIERRDPNFQYGRTQATVALVVLVGSLIATIFCLIIQQRLQKGHLTRARVTFEAGMDEDETDGLLTNEYNNYDEDSMIESVVRGRKRSERKRSGNGDLLGVPVDGQFL